MKTTRRQFTTQLATAAASFLLLPGMFCNKAESVVGDLRGILVAVEHALALLGVLQGLLPDSVNTAARYLLQVISFVDSVGQILENDTIGSVDKVRQILALAGGLVLPEVPPPIGPILQAVAASVDKFLSHFGTDQVHASQQARGVPGNVPKLEFDAKQKAELDQIEQQARQDKFQVEEWQKKALGQPQPHSSLWEWHQEHWQELINLNPKAPWISG